MRGLSVRAGAWDSHGVVMSTLNTEKLEACSSLNWENCEWQVRKRDKESEYLRCDLDK